MGQRFCLFRNPVNRARAGAPPRSRLRIVATFRLSMRSSLRSRAIQALVGQFLAVQRERDDDIAGNCDHNANEGRRDDFAISIVFAKGVSVEICKNVCKGPHEPVDVSNDREMCR